MSRTARRILKGIGLFLAAIVAVIALLFILVDERDIRRLAEHQISAATGRPVAVGGIDINLGWPLLSFEFRDVTLGNPEWAQGEGMEMAVLGRAAATLDLSALLGGTWRYPQLRVDDLTLALIRGEGERRNWRLSVPRPVGRVARPEKRRDLPKIENVLLHDVEITYLDRRTGEKQRLRVESGQVRSGPEEVTLQAEGSFRGLPARLEGTAGSLEALRTADTAYPIDLRLVVNDVRLHAEGTANPLRPEEADLQIAAEGPDLGRLYDVLRIPAPPTDAFRFRGRFQRDGPRYRVSDFAGQVGDTPLEGELLLVTDVEPPRLEGRLSSERLRPADFGAFLGEHREGGILPEARIPVERLQRAMELDLQLHAKRLLTAGSPIGSAELGIRLAGGDLRVQPLRLALAEGELEGVLTIETGGQLPSLAVDAELRGVQIATFLPPGERLDTLRARLSGRVRLQGRGDRVSEAIGAADGRVELAATEGRLDRLLVEAANLNLGEVLVLLFGDSDTAAIDCAVLAVDLDNGLGRIRSGVLDTEDSTLIAGGNINLRTQVMNLQVTGKAKDPNVLALDEPIAISGPFTRPEIEILGGGAEVLSALTLGAVAPPLAALLPFVETGGYEAPPCHALIERARESE